MKSFASLAAKSAIAFSALTAACSSDVEIRHTQPTDAAVYDISGEISSRAIDAGAGKDSEQDLSQPDIVQPETTRQPDADTQDILPLSSEVSSVVETDTSSDIPTPDDTAPQNDTSTPDAAIDIAVPATCETLEQLVAKGACDFNIAQSDAFTFQDTATALTEIDNALLTTFSGITPTITITGDQVVESKKEIVFVKGKDRIELTTSKYTPKNDPSYGSSSYIVNVKHGNQLLKQILWWVSNNKKYPYPSAQIIIDDDACNDISFSHSIMQNMVNGEILSATMWQLPLTSCTPGNSKEICSTTGATLEADCADTGNPNGANTPSVSLFQKVSGGDSKLVANSMTLQKYKDIMKKYGVDVGL